MRGSQGDAASLKADVRRLVAALSEAHEEAAASVATLARIDAVKGRMQAAHDTLRVRLQPARVGQPVPRTPVREPRVLADDAGHTSDAQQDTRFDRVGTAMLPGNKQCARRLHFIRLVPTAAVGPSASGEDVLAFSAAPNGTSPIRHLLTASQEATELSALFLRVETVFAGGDVPAIADTLATMRRSLLLVGDVPEFKGGMERLEVGHVHRPLPVPQPRNGWIRRLDPDPGSAVGRG